MAERASFLFGTFIVVYFVQEMKRVKKCIDQTTERVEELRKEGIFLLMLLQRARKGV